MIKKILQKPLFWISILSINQIVLVLNVYDSTKHLGVITSYIGNTLFILFLWLVILKFKKKYDK